MGPKLIHIVSKPNLEVLCKCASRYDGEEDRDGRVEEIHGRQTIISPTESVRDDEFRVGVSELGKKSNISTNLD